MLAPRGDGIDELLAEGRRQFAVDGVPIGLDVVMALTFLENHAAPYLGGGTSLFD